MARPREFDTEKALQGAMEIFWRQGNKGTNLPDLLTAMGLTRGSFYKAFGTKEAAYLAALDRYEDQVVGMTVKMLDSCSEQTAVQCLSKLFETKKDADLGCFICNAMVECAPFEPEVEKRTTQMADKLRQAIARVLVRYDHSPSLENALPTAEIVLHLYFGHQAMGRGHQNAGDWSQRLALVLDQ